MKAWIAELKRRRVFQTFALYIVGSWVLIQVAQAAFEAWDVPMQFLRYLWIGLALASPIALLFAWRYDITSGGIVRTSASGSEGLDDHSLQKFDYALLGALAFVLIMISIGLFRQAETDEELWSAIEASDRPAIAVMPFIDLSADGSMAYFGNGVTEALLGELGRINGLDVIARTSSFHFQDSSASLAEITAALSVNYLVEGSVSREADTVHVAAKLIQAPSGRQLWAGSFKGAAGATFSAQQDIASTVAGYLEMSVGDPRQQGGTTSFEAYEALLRGWEEEDPEIAELLYDEALAHDPDYAQAMVAKAWLNWQLMWANRMDRQDALDAALPLLDQALAISRNLDSIYALRGAFLWIQADLDAAEASLRKGLEINPSNSFALGRLARVLMDKGEVRESLALAERNVRVDPLSVGHQLDLANRRLSAGDVNGSIESFEKAIQLEPRAGWFNYAFRIGNIQGNLFRFELMRRMQATTLEPGEPLTREPRHIRMLGLWFAFMDDYHRARELLMLARSISDSSWISMDLAGVAMRSGDLDLAWREAWNSLEGNPANGIPLNMAASISLLQGTGQEKVLAHARQHLPGMYESPPDIDGIYPELVAQLTLLMRAAGDIEQSQALLDVLMANADPASLVAATILLADGNTDGALEALEVAQGLGGFESRLVFDQAFSDEPRYQALVQSFDEENALTRAEVNGMIERGEIILPTADNIKGSEPFNLD